MGKKDRSEKLLKGTAAVPSDKRIDPSLAFLFESSFGAVSVPRKPTRGFPKEKEDEGDVGADVDLSEADEEIADASDSGGQHPAAIEVKPIEKIRKRKRRNENEKLEDTYLRRLQNEEDVAEEKRMQKRSKKVGRKNEKAPEEGDCDDSPEDKDEHRPEFPIKHESLQSAKDTELEKATRTVFLGNLPSTVITSKSNCKLLKSHFSTSAGPISNIRFRSIAFSEQIPRKAAFITHKLHEKQQTLNAYIIFKTVTAARSALKLNGAVLLDRHIHVDSVAHPAPHDAKRCVFVGNLDFEAQEESLWRHFAVAGKVESVRIVRDAKTNVGKGFAYVQFEDSMAVDEALLLNDKKMPNDRKLRVTRAKAIKRNAKKPPDTWSRGCHSDPTSRKPSDNAKGSVYQPKIDPRKRDHLSRANKLLGRAAAAQLKSQGDVFEGLRATAKTDSGVKKGGSGKKGSKPRARAIARAATWKGKAGKK